MDDKQEERDKPKESNIMLWVFAIIFLFVVITNIADKIDKWDEPSAASNPFDPSIRAAVNKELQKFDNSPLTNEEVKNIAEAVTIREINRRKSHQ